MPHESKPARKDQTIVRGADGGVYIVKKQGNATKLSEADAQKLNDIIVKAEAELTKAVEGIPAIGGGVNICLPDVF